MTEEADSVAKGTHDAPRRLLLLLRHGETALNVARVLQPADTPLSDRGLRQARALALRLRAEPPARLLTSDLPRALQTAQALAQACGLSPRTSPLLRERDFGDWRGCPYDSLGFDPLDHARAPPGGESASAFAARCAQAWDWLLQQSAACAGTVAVVTHGLVIRTWLAARMPAMPLPRIGNTAVTELDAAPPHALRLLDCTRHLRGALADDAAGLSGG